MHGRLKQRWLNLKIDSDNNLAALNFIDRSSEFCAKTDIDIHNRLASTKNDSHLFIITSPLEFLKEDVQHQRLVHFLNHGQMDMKAVNTRRVEQLLPLALQHKQNREDRLHEYLLFSIDPSDFKKYKNKQMQGVHYTRDAQGGYKAQTFVMSSFIYGQSCVPFKKILYWGKKGVPKGRQMSKNRIVLKLAAKAEKVDADGKPRIGVFDGAGCNRMVLPYFHKSPNWAGFVCKFPRIRNIEREKGSFISAHICPN